MSRFRVAVFDEVCADRVKSGLDPDVVDELDRLMPRLEAAWSDAEAFVAELRGE